MTVTYLLDDGRTYSRAMVAPANARSGIWVDVEQIPGIPGYPLAHVALSTTVESTNGVPLIVERAMWWPGDGNSWHEAHNSAGATETGTRWVLAEGEVGGPRGVETYILIANTSNVAGGATVTLLFEDGTSQARSYPLPARSRTNAAIWSDFDASVQGKRFGAIVESTGTSPAQIVVERAMYSNAGGTTWAAGTNAVATRLVETVTPTPVLTVTPSTWTAPSTGGTQLVTVTASVAGSAWSAVSNQPWLTLSAANGAGNGTVTLVAATNSNSNSRTATATIAGQSVVVTQAAASLPSTTFYVWGGSGYSQYLGSFTCIFCTEFGSESINNTFGVYGSAFASTSIRNSFSVYGSPFSAFSACNEFASTPPRVYDFATA